MVSSTSERILWALTELMESMNNADASSSTIPSMPATNSFVERFNVPCWMNASEQPHQGYRNQGRRPIETFELGKPRRTELSKEAA